MNREGRGRRRSPGCSHLRPPSLQRGRGGTAPDGQLGRPAGDWVYKASMNLRLHSFWRPSSAWRVRIGLGLKGLTYSYETVDLGAGAAEPARTPRPDTLGHVPVLEVLELGQRLVLVGVHGHPPLPGGALSRATALAQGPPRPGAGFEPWPICHSAIQPLQNSVSKRFLR